MGGLNVRLSAVVRVSVLVLIVGFFGGVTASSSTAAWTAGANLAPAGQRLINPPRIAYDASGRAYAVWVDYRWPSDDGVYLAERPPGGPWGSPQLLPTSGTGYVRDLDLTVDAAGDVVVAWRGNGITVIRRPSGGTWSAQTTWSSPGSSGPGSGCPNEPSLASGADGTVLLAWTSYQSCNGNVSRWRVMATTWSASTGWQTSASVFAISPVDVNSRPAVSVAGNGDLLLGVVARNSSQQDQAWTVEGTVLGGWGSPVLRGSDASTNFGPSVAQRGGEAVIAWYGNSTWAAVRTGGSWGSQQQLTGGSTQPAHTPPSTAVDGSGNVYVAWSAITNGARAVRLGTSANGGPFADSVISSAADNPMNPQIAVNAAGDLAAAWDTVAGGVWTGVSAIRPVGDSWGSPTPISTEPSDNTTQAVTAVDATGHALAADMPLHQGFGTSLSVTVETRDPAVEPSSPVTISPAVAYAGDTVTCDPSGFGGTPPFQYAYEWSLEGTPIPGETSPTYVVQSADAESALTCQVTATNEAGSASSTSDPLVVGVTPPDFTTQTTMTGTAEAGTTLTCVPGNVTGAPAPDLDYEWLRNGSIVDFETAPTYDVLVSDAGSALACRVTATNSGGSDVSAATPRTVPSTQAPTMVTRPALGGPTGAGIGTILTCSTGTWNSRPTATIAIDWLRSGVQIDGGYGGTYTVQAADAGSTLTCQVTASNVVADVTVTASGSRTIPPAPVNNTLPRVKAATGSTWTVGGVGQCTNGGWQYAQTYTYQWLRDGNPVPGGTTALRTLVAADAGTQLSCVVTATGRGGSNSAMSAPKALAAAPAVVTAPAISGTPRPGRTLTCNRGTWTNANSFAYAWQRSGIPVSGVTTNKLVLVASDVGSTITCRVTASGQGGSTSATTAGVLVRP